MEAENLTPQIPPQPTPQTHRKEVASILGILLLIVIFVAAIFFIKNPAQLTKEKVTAQNSTQQSKISLNSIDSSVTSTIKSPTIIYGDRNGKEGPEMIFYSLNPLTKEKRKLFSIPDVEIFIKDWSATNPSMRDIKFCAAVNKFYFNYHSGSTANDSSVKEIDFVGNMKDLKFTEAVSTDYKNLDYSYTGITGFVLSKDCKKIIWSTAYYKQNEPGQNALSAEEEYLGYEIVFSDINGVGKKVLQTIKRTPENALSKNPVSWSTTDPSVVYLTNYDQAVNGNDGGLFKLDLNKNSVTQIYAIPSQNIIWDVSNNDNLIAHQQNTEVAKTNPQSFVTNLADKATLPLFISSYSNRKFSIDNSKLAAYNGEDGISIYNLFRNNKFAAPDSESGGISFLKPSKVAPDFPFLESYFLDWITSDSVIVLKFNKRDPRYSDLVMVNVNDGKEIKLDSVSSSNFQFVGISGK